MLHFHQPRAVVERIAQRDIKVARRAGIDRRLGHRHVLHHIQPLLRVHHGDRLAALRHRDLGARRDVVRALDVGDLVQPEEISGEEHRVARLHLQILVALVGLHQGHTDHEHRDADVRDDHAEIGARAARALLQADERGGDDPEGERQRESGERMPFAEGERQQQADREAHGERPAQ